MKLSRYQKISDRLERLAKATPKAYKFSVLMLLFLGYFYVLFILGVTLALMAVLVFLISRWRVSLAVALGLPLTIVAPTILRMLLISSPPPAGVELGKGHAQSFSNISRT